jgi:membrane-bound metal-dependent hydrolase YbcI (DUF457 family)
MAGFKTHITTSTVLGIGYGAGAYGFYHLPVSTCILAGGLCSVSGMLPDIDSDSGRPLRESMAFGAAVVPMMMVDRFHAMGMDLEMIILVGGAIYLMIRFGLAAVLKHYTVHRGMFHSLPAALIAAEVAFLAFGKERIDLRYFVAGGVLLGFMSHLILDEIWSIDFQRGRFRLKSSFGTAIKFWGEGVGPNLLTYALVIGLTFFSINDPAWMSRIGSWTDGQHELANRFLKRIGIEPDSTPQPADASAPLLNLNNDSNLAPLGPNTRAPTYDRGPMR